jgi:amidophosphoribosyltransferase
MEMEFCKEKCGVFGIQNNENAAYLAYLGIYALQHRGQEAAGIVSSDGHTLHHHAAMGLINHVFGNPEVFDKLPGTAAIAHNRYSTTGASTPENTQPFLVNYKSGQMASAHNGNICNAAQLRSRMEDDGSIFVTTSDTEVVMHLLARARSATPEGKIGEALSQCTGAYSIIFLSKDTLWGARDPYGVRPLILGRLNGSYLLSSETCSFDLLGAETVREINPGEIIRIKDNKCKSFPIPGADTVAHHAHCIFEHIYFSRPDSHVFGDNVDKIRRKLGRVLARECPAPQADMVIGVPDSAITGAIGYSEASGIKYDMGLIRNHYVGRTFIQPEQSSRDLRVRIKFNTVTGVLRGKHVVVVDDSIVRGTTMKSLVKLLRGAGPAGIHLRITSPPLRHPCFYGIDMPTEKEFIASNKDIEHIKDYLQVDSLGYLSLQGLLSTVHPYEQEFCVACFHGCYPAH